MKLNSPFDYSEFIEPQLAAVSPMVYQSIKGLKRTPDEAAKMNKQASKEVIKYRSSRMAFYPSYKNISKMYDK